MSAGASGTPPWPTMYLRAPMSAGRPGKCGDPGPGTAHCTENRGHVYSCYDAGEDTSWNDGQWADGWFDEAPHQCADPACDAAAAYPERTARR